MQPKATKLSYFWVFIYKSHWWNDAPLSMPLKADRHFGGQWSNHPQPHGSLLVGCRPVLRDRLAFHPKKPCILAKIMRLSKALNSHRSVTQTEWFLADPACCDPALEDTETVCASFVDFFCRTEKSIGEKRNFPLLKYQVMKSKGESIQHYWYRTNIQTSR